MHVLFLDIASGAGLLACSTEGHVVAHRAIDHRIGDHELVPLVEDALREVGWSYKDLTHLACVIGPGGFTSLRIGVSCINALSWALKIPSAGIHLSDVYAARVPVATSFLWLHSTKKAELFVRGFDDFAKEWPDPTHITIDDLLYNIQPPTTYVGELLPEHRAAIEGIGVQLLPLRPLTKTLPPFLASCEYREQILQPWYGRGW